VAEIERPGGAELERVATGRDVLQVQFGTSVNEPFHEVQVAAHQGRRSLFQKGEERWVPEQGNLYSLGGSGQPVAVGERGEQVGVVQYRVRGRERPEEILLSVALIPFLTPTTESF
jgi:hypothetical protein